jgi:hypothetical protein
MRAKSRSASTENSASKANVLPLPRDHGLDALAQPRNSRQRDDVLRDTLPEAARELLHPQALPG